MKTDVRNIYSSQLVTVHETATLEKAEELMNNYNIRHLPVVDAEDVLVGILSKSDFSALKHVDSRLSRFTVADFMTRPVKAVKKTTTVKEVAQLFINKKISSVIVVEEDEAVGIVTSEDLIRLLADNVDFMDEAEQMDLAALADEGWISTTMAQ